MHDPIPRDAYAIIIGAMKCGTTSLFSYLQEHPQICPAMVKEPGFFAEYLGKNKRLPVHYYHELWSFDRASHKYALEASTNYTRFPIEPHVPQNIYDYGISPRFIYLVRNPFDRIASHFNHMRLYHKGWRRAITDDRLIAPSNYFLQLEQYRKVFSMEQILVLDFDELKNRPQAALETTYGFLGLSPTYFPENYQAQNARPSRMELQVAKRLGRRRFDAALAYVPRPIKNAGKRLVRRAFATEDRVLSESERAFVHDRLQEDMARFHQVYGFDVRKWGFDA